jgi:hypothetical protein
MTRLRVASTPSKTQRSPGVTSSSRSARSSRTAKRAKPRRRSDECCSVRGRIATGVDEEGDVCAELLHVLRLPDFDRAERIGEFLGPPGDPELRRVADRRGGDKASRAVVFGLLAELERR